MKITLLNWLCILASSICLSAYADMVLIPAGSFIMGDTFGEGDFYDEVPTHSVSVSAFYMEETEVTKLQWDMVYQWATNHGYSFDTAGSGKAADHPVQAVNWYDCVTWCNARSEKEGLIPCYYTTSVQTTVYRTSDTDISSDCVNWNANGYRLPTEAEWEKAARGGSSDHRFPWSDADTITHNRANYNSTNSFAYDVSPTRGYHPTYNDGMYPYTSPVGVFSANGYGLYDMVGNVSEWCWDWYDGSWYNNIGAMQADTRGPISALGGGRVSRGGGWIDQALFCRAAHRYNLTAPGVESIYLGFRCARGIGAGTLQFAISNLCVNENAGSVTLTVTRSGGNFGAASVNYATQNGTASAGTDYTATSGQLSWADGNSDSQTITVSIFNRPSTQGARSFTIVLSSASGASLGSPAMNSVTINDARVGPAIKANGIVDDVIVTYPDVMAITIEMNADIHAGAPVDWWVLSLAGPSWYYLNSSMQWIQFDGNLSNCDPLYQGALFNLPATLLPALNIPGLPVSSYTFWFAVDSQMDGVLNVDGQTLADSVNVTMLSSLPAPCVKANGATGTVTVNYPDAVSITVELNARAYAGVPADWWVLLNAGSSWFYMDSVVGWTQASNWHPVYQGPLFNLPAAPVLNIPGLPVGSYTFYFAVDLPMNGILNMEQMWVDSVTVNVR